MKYFPKEKWYNKRSEPKKKRRIDMVVNKDNPLKLFVKLRIILDWHKVDNVPILLIFSPGKIYDKLLGCYRRSLMHVLPHYVDMYSDLDYLKLILEEDYSKTEHSSFIMAVFDPRKMSMTTIMAREESIHISARSQYEYYLTHGITPEERDENYMGRLMHNFNPTAWIGGTFTLTTGDFTTVFNS